ncbi:MAG: long-chain fatty acid--CoA ligase [Desulfobacterales bacterium]|nr:long-chain fatty acid--CoA ligase [Desulfobacterales bacterium]
MVEIKESWRWMEKELKTIPQSFYETCDRFPDRTAQLFNPALYHEDHHGRMTWSALRRRAEAIGSGLLSLGLKQKDRVAIMAPSGAHWTQVDLALTCSGATSVAIYPTLSSGEVAYILNDADCHVLFAGDEAILESVRPFLKDPPILEKIIVMDLAFRSVDEPVIGLGELIEQGKAWEQANPGVLTQRRQGVGLEDICTILYTSGTSGRSKGVPLTQWSISSRLEGVIESFERNGMVVDENDRTLCFLPLAHIFERGSCQMLAVLRGASIAYADKPGTLLEDMQKYNPTWINCVPRLYEKIYITFQQKMAQSRLGRAIFDWALGVGEAAKKHRRDELGRYDMSPTLDLAGRLSPWLRLKFRIADRLFDKIRGLFGNRFRFAFSASAAIAPELLEFYYTIGLAVVEGYGSTESCNACILNPLGACKPGYIGCNANGGWSRIAADGELEISGAGVFKGYLNLPEENAQVFTEDGWFRTGDLVEFSDDGYFRLVDRKKAIICTAVGKNIAPAKIEGLFSTSSVIEQVFVIGDERNFISALIVPNFGTFIDLFDKKGIAYDKGRIRWSKATGVPIYTAVGDDFIDHSLLREMIDQEVQAANERLEHWEKIKRYTIIADRFTEENGRITPTQKTKKRVIVEDYAGKIDQMYEA